MLFLASSTTAGAFRTAAARAGSGFSAHLASTHSAALRAAVLGGSSISVSVSVASQGPRGGPARRPTLLPPLQMAVGKSTGSSSGSSSSTMTPSPRRRREFKTLVGETEYEEIIKKSRFLTRAASCPTFQEAQAFLGRVSDPKASHNCWAWRGQGEERSSDDGEPGGTAGRPMLAGIESEGLMDVMVVVTRWVCVCGGGGLSVGGARRMDRWSHNTQIEIDDVSTSNSTTTQLKKVLWRRQTGGRRTCSGLRGRHARLPASRRDGHENPSGPRSGQGALVAGRGGVSGRWGAGFLGWI